MEKTNKTKKPKKEKKPKAPKAEKATEQVAESDEKVDINLVKEEKRAKRYFESVGRRKSAIARVRLFTIKPFEGDEGKITVNDKFYKVYFPTLELQQIAEASLRKLKSLNRFEAVARVKGGGIRGQAEALRHGLARVLTLFNADFRKKLKKAGYLKRDPRVKERRKYGLKKARKAPQWQKR
jgi:small subunit ribosomal protein S9